MGLFPPKPFDRTQTLERANQARSRGRPQKAIAEYQKILVHHPDDLAVHGKLAPLLAETKQKQLALQSFLAAAAGHAEKGFADRAIAVFVQSVGFYPKELDLWQRIVALHLGRGRRAEAVKVLIEARGHFRRRPESDQAVSCLRQVLELEPTHVAATADLARLLARRGDRPEALNLVRALLPKVDGVARRTLRKTEFAVAPSPASLWRWWFGD